ncbi:MAG: bis(5'-nucleosyl)-tetraphosphatase (symmetrical) YqeK [Spirochaeta sp.]|jgi:predicted HD superfamily hydrolase involved in NAD metabolism|nr:bis(5'-nucleosyl)-tetraphosphatase (symmetrical) YqeK [Spirochaeta sp.]
MNIFTNTTSTADIDPIEVVRRELSRRVTPARKAHIERVTTLLEGLTERFDLDVAAARLAGLAHDLDRDIPSWTAFALVSDWRLPVQPIERRHPKMLHGAITAARLRRRYGVTSDSVISAVRHHTLGDPSLDDLGLALFVADFCEPGRRHSGTGNAREILALPSLEQMVCRIIEFNERRFGPLEEPTAQLYARLQGD